MICLMQSQSPFSTATIILYTCIWIPFLQIKQAMLKIISFVRCQYRQAGDNGLVLVLELTCQADLPVASATMFGDIKRCGVGEGRCTRRIEETCSICLGEYAKEDLVYKLPRCGHLFHMDCIQRWLDRNHFTCPLCRSLILHGNYANYYHINHIENC